MYLSSIGSNFVILVLVVFEFLTFKFKQFYWQGRQIGTIFVFFLILFLDK